jgi:hypothetical protein
LFTNTTSSAGGKSKSDLKNSFLVTKTKLTLFVAVESGLGRWRIVVDRGRILLYAKKNITPSVKPPIYVPV